MKCFLISSAKNIKKLTLKSFIDTVRVILWLHSYLMSKDESGDMIHKQTFK